MLGNFGHTKAIFHTNSLGLKMYLNCQVCQKFVEPSPKGIKMYPDSSTVNDGMI